MKNKKFNGAPAVIHGNSDKAFMGFFRDEVGKWQDNTRRVEAGKGDTRRHRSRDISDEEFNKRWNQINWKNRHYENADLAEIEEF
jgi:hypothetical protein